MAFDEELAVQALDLVQLEIDAALNDLRVLDLLMNQRLAGAAFGGIHLRDEAVAANIARQASSIA